MAKLTLQLGVTGQGAVKGGLSDIKREASALDKVFDGLKGAGSGLMTGLGKIGLAGMGIDTLAGAARGLGDALGIGLNSELENTRAQLLAFTKSGEQTDKILADLKQEAKTTPFAFRELASATAALLPASKTAGVGLNDLMKQAQVLAALNPGEGLEGAAFSLKEALSGDFLSIVERFNLPKKRLMELKEQGVPALEAVSIALAEMGVDSSLVAGMGETMTGKWSTFMDTIDGIKQTAGAGLFDAMKEGLGGLQTLLDENMPSIEAFAAGLGSLIGQGAKLAIEAFVGLGQALGPLFTMLPDIGAAIGQAVSFFATGAGDVEKFRGVLNSLLGPTGAQGVMEIFTNLSGFVRETVIPMFVSFGGIMSKVMSGDLGGALSAAGTHLTTFGPKLIGTLAEWGQRFLQWVAPMIPPLLAKLGELGGKVLGWVAEQAPPLLKTFVTEWVPAAINWLLQAGIDMGPKLGAFLEGVLGWVIKEGPGLAAKFVGEWVPAAIGWLVEAGVKIAPKLVEFLASVGVWVQNTGIPLMQVATLALGQGIIDGIVAGVKNFGPAIGTAVGNAAQAAVDAAKAKLGIKSPSKVTHDEIGVPMGQGIITGIFSKEAGVQEAAVEVVMGGIAAGNRAAKAAGAEIGATFGKTMGQTAGTTFTKTMGNFPMTATFTKTMGESSEETKKLGNRLQEALGSSQMGRAIRNVNTLDGALADVLSRVGQLNMEIPGLVDNIGQLPPLPPGGPSDGGNWGLFPTPGSSGAGAATVPINITNYNDMRGMSQDEATRAVADPLAMQVKRYVMSGAF